MSATQTASALTAEVKAVIGATGERIEASLPWGIEREGLRVFTQAIMDPDPRYWDDEFAKKTKYGAIITPPIYCTYLARRARPGDDDPITRAFAQNPESDGIGGVQRSEARGGLPSVPTPLKRILNAGNEIELRQYPKIGDRIFSQARYSDIRERITKDGTQMLIITTETTYTNQNGEVLCILRASQIRR
ncbi:MAG TPA: MaoC family dehydratase N-terminal domain-containing protein [Burkholderiales bacterium]|nr:MaoC family dehydratase N-terminal domain-containing protein [Burkholderiales bacterium]